VSGSWPALGETDDKTKKESTSSEKQSPTSDSPPGQTPQENKPVTPNSAVGEPTMEQPGDLSELDQQRFGKKRG